MILLDVKGVNQHLGSRKKGREVEGLQLFSDSLRHEGGETSQHLGGRQERRGGGGSESNQHLGGNVYGVVAWGEELWEWERGEDGPTHFFATQGEG